MRAMGELKTLLAADGETILAAAYRESPLLPRPHAVERSNIEGWPDAETEGPVPTMVALRVPPEFAKDYGVPASDGIKPIPLDDRHVTLVYLGDLDGDQRRKLHRSTRKWLADGEWSPLEGRAQGWGTFNQPDDKTVLWMSWDVPGLSEVREDLVSTLKNDGFSIPDDHGFVPHETIANIDGRLRDIPDYPEMPLERSFNGITVGEGSRWTEYDFPLNMSLREAASTSIVAALEFLRDPELEQLSDGELDALVAAGGLDRNRGNAEKLRRYWTVGPGGAKIRWNTPGDWTRCVRHLSKHLGPRAKGFCQLRHREMTRLYTGDMKHRILYGWGGKPGSYWAKVAGKSAASNDENSNNTLIVVDRWGTPVDPAGTVTAGGDAMQEVMEREGESPILMMLGGQPQQNVGFHIPLLLPEGIESGDGRTFEKGVVESRQLPIPLLWQPNSMQGHDGAVIVGRIDSMEPTDAGMGNVRGVFDTSPAAMEAVRLIREGFLRGVSADLDKFEAKVLGKGPGTSTAKKGEDDEEEIVSADKMKILKGRIMAATLVAKPAFEEAMIQLLDPEPVAPPEDGDYRGEQDIDQLELALEFERMVREGELLTLSNMAGATMSLVAAAVAPPVDPPSAWFDDPRLTKPTHLTITDEGRVFGHIAAWHVDHIGMGFGTRPPRSRTGYSYFRTGVLRTAEGDDVRVGQLTLSGGHAGLEADARRAVQHYDDTSSAFADVVAGEDSYGIWVAGALRPEITAAQVRMARASSPSGDWRPIEGRLELVAICQVNVPGFPVVEARVASGQIVALVAAGASVLTTDFLRTNADLLAQAAKARETVMAPLQELALAASASMARVRMTTKPRPWSGWAMADGGFRIRTAEDVEFSLIAYGASERKDKDMVRNHIARCAMQLDRTELIPEIWVECGLTAGLESEFRSVDSKKRKELAKKGDALPDGSYPIVTLADLNNAIKAYGRSKKSDRAKVRRHIIKRAKALKHPELIPGSWKALALVASATAVEGGSLPRTEKMSIIASAAEIGHVDQLPDNWDPLIEQMLGLSEGLVASIRSVRQRSWDEGKVSRDDIGRFRKIYYRLRQGGASEAPKVKAALRAIKQAEEVAMKEGASDKESASLARDLLEEAAQDGGVDERTQSDLIESAQDMADLVDRIEVRGGSTKIDFGQLPAQLQDILERYLKENNNLEERITKHFQPFVDNQAPRSVDDIVNLIERIVIDAQKYHEGYDMGHV